ncbi:pilus assembly protein [Escherichia coli]|nr:pilus assembly protein [Escherichia coli]
MSLTCFFRFANDFVYSLVRKFGNDSNLLIVFYVQIMPDDR